MSALRRALRRTSRRATRRRATQPPATSVDLRAEQHVGLRAAALPRSASRPSRSEHHAARPGGDGNVMGHHQRWRRAHIVGQQGGHRFTVQRAQEDGLGRPAGPIEGRSARGRRRVSFPRPTDRRESGRRDRPAPVRYSAVAWARAAGRARRPAPAAAPRSRPRSAGAGGCGPGTRSRPAAAAVGQTVGTQGGQVSVTDEHAAPCRRLEAAGQRRAASTSLTRSPHDRHQLARLDGERHVPQRAPPHAPRRTPSTPTRTAPPVVLIVAPGASAQAVLAAIEPTHGGIESKHHGVHQQRPRQVVAAPHPRQLLCLFDQCSAMMLNQLAGVDAGRPQAQEHLDHQLVLVVRRRSRARPAIRSDRSAPPRSTGGATVIRVAGTNCRPSSRASALYT